MQPDATCPRCGQPVVENRCPRCGSIYPPGYFGESKKSSALKYLIIGLVAYLAVGAWLLVMAGHRMMERAKQAGANPVQPLYPHHQGPVAAPSQLNGSGTIYLIQMGDHTAPYSLDDFALWLRTKYKLDVRVLPPSAANKSTWDTARGQYVAEALYEQMKRDHADLAADANAYLIGFTDADMYSDHLLWKSSFTQRDMERVAVIYEAGSRIAVVTDSRGRAVRYGYDGQNRLTSVSYSTGEVCRYEYDSTQHLLAFSEAPNAKAAPRVLMRNEYAQGLLVKQTMADGGVYSYSYDSADPTKIRSATVKSADGRIFHLDIAYSSSTVHEEAPPRPTLSQR